MKMEAIGTVASGGPGERLARLAAREGSGVHSYLVALSHPRAASRDLADAVHLLCTLHGRMPGVIDLAAEKPGQIVALPWLLEAVAGFTAERAYLTRLMVAAGPLPSTPGQAETESAVLGQRHALEMLAGSDRRGCALGAAMALMLDWRPIRTLLDVAADRFGIARDGAILPRGGATLRLADAVSEEGTFDRALAFGAQQLLVQHRGLWSLLESRAAAREV